MLSFTIHKLTRCVKNQKRREDRYDSKTILRKAGEVVALTELVRNSYSEVYVVQTPCSTYPAAKL